jgi:hypothetical protein
MLHLLSAPQHPHYGAAPGRHNRPGDPRGGRGWDDPSEPDRADLRPTLRPHRWRGLLQNLHPQPNEFAYQIPDPEVPNLQGPHDLRGT